VTAGLGKVMVVYHYMSAKNKASWYCISATSVKSHQCAVCTFVMAALSNKAGHYIFILWFLLLSFYLPFFFSSPILSRRTLDVYHISTHGVALVRIYDAGLKCAACGSLKILDAKNRQKLLSRHPSNFQQVSRLALK